MEEPRQRSWVWLIGLLALWSPDAFAQWGTSSTAWRFSQGHQPIAGQAFNQTRAPGTWTLQRFPSAAPTHRAGAPGQYSVRRQAVIDGGAVILSLPALIIDFVPLLGNVVALSSGIGRFGWGIAGIGMSAVGTLLIIPTFGIAAVAIALGLLQATLMGLSVTNLILALIERRNRAREAAQDQPALSRGASPHKQLMVSVGF